MRLIDADAYIEQYCSETCGHGFCDHPKCYDYTVNTLLEFPTIDPVKHGDWIPFNVSGVCAPEYQPVKCSLCGTNYGHYMWQEYLKYCPNCGAKMDGEQQLK